LHTANDVLHEDPSTPNHNNREALGAAAMRDPTTWGRNMYNFVIVQPGINEYAADITQIDDTTIMNAVSGLWDTFANQIPGAIPMAIIPPPPFIPPPPSALGG